MSEQPDVIMSGCATEPLMGYLKAIGILRLVSGHESAKGKVFGAWQNNRFILRSPLDKTQLTTFFLEHYQPTPIIVPWSGNDFFDIAPQSTFPRTRKTPTGSSIICAFLACTAPRFSAYRQAIRCALDALPAVGIASKLDMKGEAKSAYISRLRATAPEELLSWIDAAAVMEAKKPTFSAILGSGGGSDGNTHFSDNFMQNLWEMLPEFDDQRELLKSESINLYWQKRRELLANALWGDVTTNLVKDRTSSLYDAGAVGGPNAGQGFERSAYANPWNFILSLEGAAAFGGAIARRIGGGRRFSSSFPFQFQLSVAQTDCTTNKEEAGKEIWLPVWERFASFSELTQVLADGRADVGRRAATLGVEMARAAASLGIDRGISSFNRYAIVKGRVGGDNYNTAACLGRFEPPRQVPTGIDLLRQVDSWLNRFRSACRESTAPARFVSALRRIDDAVFNYCKYGGQPQFQDVLIAFGRAEEHLAMGERFRKNDRRTIPPLSGLSPQWIAAAYDESADFDLAWSLAAVYDPQRQVGPLRANLELIEWTRHVPTWAEHGRGAIWRHGALSQNLASVLERRMMDATRSGASLLPLRSSRAAPLKAISRFIAGDADDNRIDDLLWGFVLVDHRQPAPKLRSTEHATPPLPRAYALLKLLFLPYPLAREVFGDGQTRVRPARRNETGFVIRSEPHVLPLLRRGDIAGACAIAMRRLRASGFEPLPYRTSGGKTRDREWQEKPNFDAARLAASLLFPISAQATDHLFQLVTRKQVAKP